MGKLFKYLKTYWKMAFVILLVLLVQVYCDLSLPSYTSDIVNVGIQQAGVDDKIPEAISEEEMEKVLLFVQADDRQTVLDAYEKDENTYNQTAYVLKKNIQDNEEKTEELEEILSVPMMMTAGFEQGSDTTAKIEEQLRANIPAEMLPKDATVFDILKMLPQEQLSQMTDKMKDQMDDMPDTIIEQAGISYIKTAYEDLGMDMNQIQFHYLFVTGGKMLALALLGMLASVLVGLLASRVGASTGRDLRGKVFRKVVGFSNNEFDQFSTASLITRSTNDIQQIQMLIVMLLRIVLYAPLIAIGGIYKVFQTNVSMSWIIALAAILIVLVVSVLFIVAMPKFKIMQQLVDKLNLVYQLSVHLVQKNMKKKDSIKRIEI